MRWKLPRQERERKAALEAAFKTTLYYAKKNECGPFPATSTLFNIGLYLLIAERDIQALKIDALTHPDEWTRKLNARIILLTIYEWDADKVSGKALRDALDQIDPPDDLKAEAIDVLRGLRAVQGRVKKQFTVVRNTAIAHRDPNVLAQFRAIQDLDVMGVINVAGDFYFEVGRFVSVLTKIMGHNNNLSSFLRQWTSR